MQINDYSLRAFFYDYCIIPSNSALSRGYLQGLETLVTHLGPDSILSKACRAVSFGARGQALQRPALLDRGETLHQECLEALAGGMVLATPTAITEYQLVAMMLGLYQVFIHFTFEHRPGEPAENQNGTNTNISCRWRLQRHLVVAIIKRMQGA